MSVRSREATAVEAERLWPAARAARLFETVSALRDVTQREPWRVRTDSHGDAALLERWRDHLDVLAVRALWAPDRRIAEWVRDLAENGARRGFGRLLSPLLPERRLDAWLAAGMTLAEPIVALQCVPTSVRVPAPSDVEIRRGSESEVAAAAKVDEASFSEFWRYAPGQLLRASNDERFAVAVSADAVVGYTLCSVNRGAAVLSRLAVAPHVRRHGIGSALLSDVAGYAQRAGALTLTLCTQESNEASRAMYRSSGLLEIAERYGLAVADLARRVPGAKGES